MSDLPIIAKFDENKLNEILNGFSTVKFLSKETRQNFSGEFPTHTRYFSNGDIPLVALINVSGKAIFGYDNKHANLSAGDLVFFDDSKPHSWVFKDNNLEIFYYRLSDRKGSQITQGDYCLDNYF
jgi:hypothetical protein